MKPQLPSTAAFVVICSFLSAQEWTRAQAVAEITELTTRSLPREQWPERNAKMMAWLEKVEKTKLELGDHAFTKAIPHYFNRDYERAGKVLFDSLSKQPKLATKVRYSNLGDEDLPKRIRELLGEGRQQRRY